MKGRIHNHNLRSAPHSERTLRANNRAGSKNRSNAQQPRWSAPDAGRQHQLDGPKTLDPARSQQRSRRLRQHRRLRPRRQGHDSTSTATAGTQDTPADRTRDAGAAAGEATTPYSFR